MKIHKKLKSIIEELDNFEIDNTSYLNDPEYKKTIDDKMYSKIKNLRYYLNLVDANRLVEEINKFKFKEGLAPYILEDLKNGFILDETQIRICELEDANSNK